MNARFRWLPALLLAASAVGCAEHLATLPSSDHYLASRPETPKLDGDQQEFVDNVNKELAKLGIAAATPGAYEMHVAALTANIYLSKMWHGSRRSIADQSATPGTKTGGALLDGGVFAPLYPVSDEPASNDPKTIHWEQQFWARGVPMDFKHDEEPTDYPRGQLYGDEIEKAVNATRPALLYGRLRIGVARLAERGDNKVIFVLVLRDERAVLTSTPPRKASPGTGFEVAGQIVDKSLAKMRLGLLQPDGNVHIQEIEAHEDGTFSAHVDLPEQPGIYLITLAGRGYSYAVFNAPVFVGVEPTPWPVSADPAAPPVDGSRALAKQLASGVNAWRLAHKLPKLDVDAKLSSIAKSEAGRTAQVLAKVRGSAPISHEVAQGLEHLSSQGESELTSAGYDLALVHHYFDFRFDDTVPDWLARLPWDAIAAGAIASTDARHLGLGVLMAPKNDKDDSSSALYVIDWFMVVRPPPPPIEKPAETPPPAPGDAGSVPRPSPMGSSPAPPVSATPAQVTPAAPQ
jgi:hypothetical protein